MYNNKVADCSVILEPPPSVEETTKTTTKAELCADCSSFQPPDNIEPNMDETRAAVHIGPSSKTIGQTSQEVDEAKAKPQPSIEELSRDSKAGFIFGHLFGLFFGHSPR